MPRPHQTVSGNADGNGQSSLSSEPLLNEEQRLALEAALSGSLIEKTGASSECLFCLWVYAAGLSTIGRIRWMSLG